MLLMIRMRKTLEIIILEENDEEFTPCWVRIQRNEIRIPQFVVETVKSIRRSRYGLICIFYQTYSSVTSERLLALEAQRC